MVSCDHFIAVSAYIDGELEPDEADALQSHLQQCPACRQELARLQAIAEWLLAAPVPEMPAGVALRLRRHATPVRDRAVLRTAKALTAAAAAVLITCSALLWRERTAAAPPQPSVAWESVAVMPAAQVPAEPALEEDVDVELARLLLGSALSAGGPGDE